MTYLKGAMTSSLNRGERTYDPGNTVLVPGGESR